MRLGLLSSGSALMGVGVALAAASTFGADAVALLWDGMHRYFHMSLGTANLVFSFVFLVWVWIVDRKQIGIGTILSPLIEGIAIDVCAFFLFPITGTIMQLMAMLTGIILIGVGTGIYAAADIGRGPYIGITFAISDRYHLSLTWFRTSLDFLCLLIGLFLGATLSIGPVVSVILMGVITNQSTKMVRNRIVQPYLA